MTMWTQAALILFVVLALLLVLNAAGHLGSWLAKVGRAWLASRPPKLPEIGPVSGPQTIASGNWVRSGLAWKTKYGKPYNDKEAAQ